MLPLIDTIETIGDVRIGISLRARSTNLDLEAGDEMDCSLTEQLGQETRSMLAVDVPLAFEEETSKPLGESLTLSYLGSYSIICDLPPQTAITSIETRAVY